jgi:predicted lactoylglutathione lyase
LSIIDHVNLPVSDLARSRRFYQFSLEPLGYRFVLEDGPAVGFGIENWNFGIIETTATFPSIHVAFVANTRQHVDDFFAAALLAGGRANGAPGLRATYHPEYYAAFVLDPDGHNVEAVFRGTSTRPK